METLQLNAKLQQKKNALRKALKEKGVQKKGGKNNFDHYSYFSEAQYKMLFTELFSEYGLELTFTELAYEMFDGSQKQANGRMPRLEFTLTDIETGFCEKSVITGEGIDKGDKAGYKAYTGALKYYLATTFMVATGDDPETESPNVKTQRKASPKQIEVIKKIYAEKMDELLNYYKITKIEELSMQNASALIKKHNER